MKRRAGWRRRRQDRPPQQPGAAEQRDLHQPVGRHAGEAPGIEPRARARATGRRHAPRPARRAAASPAPHAEKPAPAAARRRAQIVEPPRRVPLPGAPTPGSDTVYLTVVDRDRMAVSLINSLYSAFGVAVATEEEPASCCRTAAPVSWSIRRTPIRSPPRKRPMHTNIPGMAMRDGRCAMPFGVMGAHYQPMGHAQVVTNMIDYGMDVQAAIELPARLLRRGSERGQDAACRPRPSRGSRSAGTRSRWRPPRRGRGPGDRHRLGPRRADRRLRPAQGRLRDGLLRPLRGSHQRITYVIAEAATGRQTSRN